VLVVLAIAVLHFEAKLTGLLARANAASCVERLKTRRMEGQWNNSQCGNRDDLANSEHMRLLHDSKKWARFLRTPGRGAFVQPARFCSYLADSSSKMPEMRNCTSFSSVRLAKPCFFACSMKARVNVEDLRFDDIFRGGSRILLHDGCARIPE